MSKMWNRGSDNVGFIAITPFLMSIGMIVVDIFEGTVNARFALISFVTSAAISLLIYAILKGISNYRKHGRI
mgnify:FL=1